MTLEFQEDEIIFLKMICSFQFTVYLESECILYNLQVYFPKDMHFSICTRTFYFRMASPNLHDNPIGTSDLHKIAMPLKSTFL